MARFHRAAAATVLMGTLSACAVVSGAPLLPARLAAPVLPACIAQAEAFAAEQTGQRITLGNAAFAGSDELVLERTMPRDAQGRLLDGRERATPPQVFKLSARGSSCLMSHPASGRTMELDACTCSATQPTPR
jgi:hypothetical protein